jgi:cysteine-rich repeat protein
MPGDVELVGVDVHPCCGNGVLDESGCGQVGGSPCEQCDDGNDDAGDGCSALCRIEGRYLPIGCGDGTVQAGLGEECDRNDDAPCRGRCRPDCTCPRFVRGDVDADGDLDPRDFAVLRACLSGPAQDFMGKECAALDQDGDGRIDLRDFHGFQNCFAGADVLASSACGN